MNVVGPYFLTTRLVGSTTLHMRQEAHDDPATLQLPLLRNAPAARVINVSSSAHFEAPGPTGIEFKSLLRGLERDEMLKRWGVAAPHMLYAQSKLVRRCFRKRKRRVV